MVLDRLTAPVVLAPLGGGPSTPELAAAVSGAGGFGFVAGAYLTPDALRDAIGATRSLTDRPFGVNVFCPVAGPASAADYEGFARRVRAWGAAHGGLEPGDPAFGDDGFDAKLDVIVAEAPAVASFAFGCPPAATVARLRERGIEAWVTVATPEEADQAVAAGADALIAQGAEAGGHRGGFRDDDEAAEPIGLLALLQLIAARGHDVPVVASGGIASGAGIAAALCAGARAAQLGTGFLLCPEAGTPAPYRAALAGAEPTALTRAFTGRLARGIRNDFLDEFSAGAPRAYPEVNALTAPMRARAREEGDSSAINLWAGESYPLARELPAGELVQTLAVEAHEASARLRAALGSPAT